MEKVRKEVLQTLAKSTSISAMTPEIQRTRRQRLEIHAGFWRDRLESDGSGPWGKIS